MLLILVGVLLIFAGLLFTAAQAIWRGRFRREGRSFSAAGFGLRSNWPGLVLIALGTVLLLGQAVMPR